MGFIIRSVFWLSLVLLLIPFGATGEDGKTMVNPLQAMFAAKGAIEDIAGMCERRPDVCTVGAAAVHTITVRAREGARIAYSALEGYGAGEEVAGAEKAPASDGDAIAGIIAAADAQAITGSVPTSR